MGAILLFAGLVLGILIGATIGYLYARGRIAAATTDLTSQASAAEERARAADQRAALIDGQLAERFQACRRRPWTPARHVSWRWPRAGCGRRTSRPRGSWRPAAPPWNTWSGRSRTRSAGSKPSSATPTRPGTSHAALAEQVNLTRHSTEELRDQTQALVTALRRPEARGRWGEMQLRRVVELAGMSARCDFDEQVCVTADDGGAQRPDMVVRLAGGKNIVVDSKVSLAAYLEAVETADESVRAARLDAHARHVREHVDRLAAKAYWTALSPAPEFVVLFIPGEAFLAPALERDPQLLEHAMARKVHIATPTTLVTMLRTAQYAWQQEALSENARAVFDLGRELHARIAGLSRTMDTLGRALTKAVTAYNQTVGSLESRVLVSARRLSQLGVVDGELPSPAPVEETARALSAPELADAPELAEPAGVLAELDVPKLTAAELARSESDTESPEISARDQLTEATQWT